MADRDGSFEPEQVIYKVWAATWSIVSRGSFLGVAPMLAIGSFLCCSVSSSVNDREQFFVTAALGGAQCLRRPFTALRLMLETA
jgi:hypothetical protein